MGFNANITRVSLSSAAIMLARSTSGVLGPYIPVGNAPKFEFSQMGDEVDSVKDFTRVGMPPLGDILKSRIPEFSLSLMECDATKLAMMFMGTAHEYTQAATPVTTEDLGAVYVGGIYKTAKLAPGSIVLVTDEGTPVTFVAGTDYRVVDLEAGLIEIIALPATVVEGDLMHISYTPAAKTSADKIMTVHGGSVTAIEGSLLAVGYPSKGPKHMCQIWRCQISPDGAFPFVSENRAEYGLKIKVLSHSSHPEGLFDYTQLTDGSAT
jgi:hypothetical protein